MTTTSLDCIEIDPGPSAQWVVIWLHGLGADGHDFEALVPELRLSHLPIRFIFPHAPMRSITINMGMVMRGWYDIVEDDLSKQVDYKGIEKSAAQLGQLIQQEIDAGIPSDHIILAGFSQGGVIVLEAGLRLENPLAGILALSTYCPTLSTLNLETNAANHRVPILMAHGEYDPLIPISLAQLSRDSLKNSGFDVQWVTYPMGHEVCFEEVAVIRQWFLDITT